MFAVFDDIPSPTSLLMRCGYHSKVCFNTRATKPDGMLHRLCEFHRRKADMGQWRLHKRQREERVKRRQAEAAPDIPAKRVNLSDLVPIAVDPIPYDVGNAAFGAPTSCEHFWHLSHISAGEFTSSSITPEDFEILELLLPVQPPELFSPCSNTAVNGTNFTIV